MSAPSAAPSLSCDVAALPGSKPDVLIKTGGHTFKAHSDLLRKFSTRANVMPEPFVSWDLDTLQVFDGNPPDAKVVAAWLETLYWHKESPNSPKTLQEALPVLRFAEDVGSPARMLHTIVSNVTEEWALKVATDNGAVVALPIVGNEVYVLQTLAGTHISGNMWYHLCKVDMHVYKAKGNSLDDLSSGVEYQAMVSTSHLGYRHTVEQIAEQLEELLFMANKMRSKRLAAAVQNFIRRQRVGGGADGILHGGAIDTVISDRVRKALGTTDAAGEAWVKWVTGDDSRV